MGSQNFTDNLKSRVRRGSRIVWLWCLDFTSSLYAYLYLLTHRKSWVSYRARVAIRQQGGRVSTPISQWTRNHIRKVFHPDGWLYTFIACLILIVPLQVLSYSGTLKLPHFVTQFFIVDVADNTVHGVIQSSWQVLAAILGLSLVISVFLIELVRDREFEARIFPTFIEHTKIMFIVTFGLLSIISIGVNSFLVGNNAINQSTIPSAIAYNQILFIINIFFLLMLYWNTFRLINPRYFRQMISRETRKKVRRSIVSEILYRHKFQIIHQEAESLGFHAELFRPDHLVGFKPQNYPIKDPETTFEIFDSNLGLLEKSAKRSDSLQNGNQNDKLRVMVFPRYRLSLARAEIAMVPEDSFRSQVTGLIRRAVKVIPLGDDDYYVAEEELLLNRDILKDALRKGKTETVRELLAESQELLLEFLRSISEFGVEYSFDTARTETGFYSDWPVVTKIQRYYLQLLPTALTSDDEEIIFAFVKFPYDIMVMSLRYRDHLIFQRFSRLYGSIYFHAHESDIESDLRRSLSERSWRLLVNFYEFEIRPILQKNESSREDIESLTDYSIFLLVILNEMLKSSIDKGEITETRALVTAAKDIGSWIGPSPIRTAAYFNLGLPITEPSDDINRQELVGAQLLRIQENRRILFFGLGTWISHLYETGKLSQDEFVEFVILFSTEFDNLNEFYNLYNSIITSERSEDLFGWDWWELKERPEVGGQAIAQQMMFQQWLGKFYLYRSIELIPQNIEATKELGPTPASKGISDSLVELISEIEVSEPWRSVIIEKDPQQYEKKKTTLLYIHNQAADRQRVIEEDRLIRQELDDRQIAEFYKSVEKAWREQGTLRNLFMLVDSYEEKDEGPVPEGFDAIELKSIDPKGAFSPQENVIYADWGSRYGRSMARREDIHLAKELNSIEFQPKQIGEFDDLLNRIVSDMKNAELSPIILFSGPSIRAEFSKSHHFRPSWQTDVSLPNIQGVEGTYQEALVVRLAGIEDNDVVVIDLNHYATLVQYPPRNAGQFPLFINVEELSVDRALELMKVQPNLAKDPVSQRILDREEALRWYQLRVLVEVSELIRLENPNPFAGHRIRFTVLP